jgi:hypothetical protein
MRRGCHPVAATLTVLAVAAFGTIAAAQPLAPPRPDDKREADTLKERLSDKASDEQRLDNCRVPVEKRGSKPRPDCPRPTPPAEARK